MKQPRRFVPKSIRLPGSVVALGLWLLSSATLSAQPTPTSGEYKARLMMAHSDGENVGIVADIPDFLHQGSPDWSADGKLIALDGFRSGMGEKGSDSQIIIINLNESSHRILGDGGMPSFSPDAKRIAYSRYSPHHGVWMKRIDGPDSEPVLLDEQGWGADWSPDGTRIAYTLWSGGSDNICLHHPADGTKEFVFKEGESPYRRIFWNFAWSPDSKFIAFRATKPDGNQETAIVDTRGASYGLTTVFAGPSDYRVTWTPDGKLLGARSHQGKMQMYTLDPTHPDQPPVVFPLAPDRSVLEGVISPDSKLIAFIMRPPLPDFAAK